MNIVVSTSSFDISIMMSSSSTITGINYILMTFVLLIMHQLSSKSHINMIHNYFYFYIQQHKQPVWIPILVL